MEARELSGAVKPIARLAEEKILFALAARTTGRGRDGGII
jgi:hypothetical protein